jgi:hypothetical protein
MVNCYHGKLLFTMVKLGKLIILPWQKVTFTMPNNQINGEINFTIVKSKVRERIQGVRGESRVCEENPGHAKRIHGARWDSRVCEENPECTRGARTIQGVREAYVLPWWNSIFAFTMVNWWFYHFTVQITMVKLILPWWNPGCARRIQGAWGESRTCEEKCGHFYCPHARFFGRFAKWEDTIYKYVPQQTVMSLGFDNSDSFFHVEIQH